MIHNKFAIADTHFFHANILKFIDDKGKRIRGIFSSCEEMHEYMVEKWNSVVKPSDYVYHLGDVTFQYGTAFNVLMRRLNGRKTLIVGNHDKIWNPALQANFAKCDYWKGFKELNFTMSHIPLMLSSLRDGAFNVHGHTHERILGMPYINVCVETRDYTPVSFEELAVEIATAKLQLKAVS